MPSRRSRRWSPARRWCPRKHRHGAQFDGSVEQRATGGGQLVLSRTAWRPAREHDPAAAWLLRPWSDVQLHRGEPRRKTHSVVVTTTLSSNPFAGDSFWLGGTGMSAAIADLFVGDRAALTASAVDAGYAAKYGLDPPRPGCPDIRAGRALAWANLVSGAAGFLVARAPRTTWSASSSWTACPWDHPARRTGQAGRIRGVRPGPLHPGPRDRRAFNLYNSSSTVNADLTAARPDGSTASCSMAVSTRIRCAAAIPYPVRAVPRCGIPPAAEPTCRRRVVRRLAQGVVRRQNRRRRRPGARDRSRDLHAERYGARRRDRRSADGDAASRARGLRAVVTNDHSLGEPETGHPGRLSLTSSGKPWSTL